MGLKFAFLLDMSKVLIYKYIVLAYIFKSRRSVIDQNYLPTVFFTLDNWKLQSVKDAAHTQIYAGTTIWGRYPDCTV